MSLLPQTPSPDASPAGERRRAPTLVSPSNGGAVQSDGLVVVLEPKSLRVVDISDNTETLFGESPRGWLGRRLDELFPLPACRKLAAVVEGNRRATIAELSLGRRGERFEAVVGGETHGHRVVELEPVSRSRRIDPAHLATRLRDVLAHLRASEDANGLAMRAVDELRALTQLDRICLIRFEPSGGQVVAESLSEGAASWREQPFSVPGEVSLPSVGCHLADLDSEPARMIEGTDVSGCALSGGDDEERQLLRSLGVRAVITLPLQVQGRVWGAVTGHQVREPVRLGHDLRCTCATVVQALSWQLESLQRDAERRSEARASELVAKIVARSSGRRQDWMGLVVEAQLLSDLVDADGVAILIGDSRVTCAGSVPSDEEIIAIERALSPRLQSEEVVLESDRIVGSTAGSSVLAVNIPAERPYRLMWFRRHGRRREPEAWPSGRLGHGFSTLDLGAVRELRRRLVERSARQLDEMTALNRELEAATAVRDEFFSALSHELRTPLNTIVGWAEMLAEGDLGERQSARAVEVIGRNAEALRRQVDDLLDVSRILRDKLRLELECVDLESTVEKVVETVSPDAEAKGLSLTWSVEDDARMVEGDAERISQVLWNLLDNAVKFTESGEVSLRVTRCGDDVSIRVSDTGAGIDPALLPDVFDRFRQDRQGQRDARRGLGLGLALVRMLVERHGGHAEAESEGPGRGATFTVTLPTSSQEPVTPVVSEPGELVSDPLEGVKLLVVEDDPDSAELVASALRMQGAEVILAYDAEDALERLNPSPDLVISDLDLPGMNGFELAETLRSSERHSTLPLIALSAFTSQRQRARALRVGFDAFFSKPADIDALVRAIAATARTAP